VAGRHWHERTRAPMKFGDFFGDFGGFLEGLEWFRTESEIVFRNQGPGSKISGTQGPHVDLQ
jgi:hypothetical protein